MYKFTYTGPYESYENCEFSVGRYYNGNLGIEIWSPELGPITKVTVNPDIPLEDDRIAVKSYSENEGMDKFLISLGLIEDNPIKVVRSGFVNIPVHKLTDKGKEIFVSD